MWQLRTDKDALVEAAVKQVLPPCQVKCPIRESIQRTNVMISMLPNDPEKAREGVVQIGDYLYERNPFFTVCGYVCGICESECNYKTKGGSVKRRLLKRFLSDIYTPYLPTKPPLDIVKDKGKVAVIGGGPSGLMCAWGLSTRGYDVTIFDDNPKLGGAVRYIPHYRLPEDVLDTAVEQIVRIGGIKVEKDFKVGGDNPIAKLTEQGFRAFFIATGTPHPRPLTLGVKPVESGDMENVGYGLTLLDQVGKGKIPSDYYLGQRVIVVGGGNVAFDAARTARRLGGDVTVVCLETLDKNHRDAIPADAEEIEGARQEGIRIVASRGVGRIMGNESKFAKIDCPKCVRVFDERGFNPEFDPSDHIEVEGDVLLITIGQMPDRSLLQFAGLFDERGRLTVDPLTHQSLENESVFIGGDVRKVGFMVDAMAEGRQAAYAIDRYLKGAIVQRWAIEFEGSEPPRRAVYKTEPPAKWTSPDNRMNFGMFEVGFTLEEAIEEARRCLECGPCVSCKACVATGIQPALPTVKVNERICSGCGVCVTACNYHTCHMVERPVLFEGRVIGQDTVSFTDPLLCKSCGQCVAACPAGARSISPDFSAMARDKIAEQPGIVCFACKFGWAYAAEDDRFASLKEVVPVICIGKVRATDILEAFTKKGANGVLLLGCAQGDCHFMDGNLDAQKRVIMIHKIMESFGIRKERLEVVTSIDPRGDKMPVLIASLRDRLNRLGPLEWKRHLSANDNK
ncbi:MAG TPA: hypothetical protein DCR97_07745 [Deltaproteobacteria bacterium]|nr:hypothetical protein [Deltaproteobacteria bacterium]